MLAHPKADEGVVNWFDGLASQGVEFAVPEIADYEVRRSLILNDLERSIARLDVLCTTLLYLPVTTAGWRRAASFWAQARKAHRPGAHEYALDGDMILAAQAVEANAVIATGNVRHLESFADARLWSEITSSDDLSL